MTVQVAAASRRNGGISSEQCHLPVYCTLWSEHLELQAGEKTSKKQRILKNLEETPSMADTFSIFN